jgi:hypothetical protein
MNDRRTTTDPAAERDSGVSSAYRDVATERAPEHLDRAILEAAAREARPRYSRLRLWTRPVAWAAVVMLSVTLILQTNQAPLNSEYAPASSRPAFDADELREQDGEFLDANKRAADEVAERKAEAPVRKSELSANREQAPTDVQGLRVTDDTLLERAEEMALIQQGASEQPQPASAARQRAATQASADSVASFVASPADTPSLCDETAKAQPETWLECIVELEAAGHDVAASEERELLAKAFPDFDAP